MRTCPAPGLGISRSTIWKSAPALGTCATFIGAVATFAVAIMPPLDSQSIVGNACWRARAHCSPHQFLYSNFENGFKLDRGAEQRLATPYTRRQGFLSFP